VSSSFEICVIKRAKGSFSELSTKKRSITFLQDMPLFWGRLAMKCDDYQPPQAARTGATYAITVAATTNIPSTIFFIISPP
jgi:hypothetical protein